MVDMGRRAMVRKSGMFHHTERAAALFPCDFELVVVAEHPERWVSMFPACNRAYHEAILLELKFRMPQACATGFHAATAGPILRASKPEPNSEILLASKRYLEGGQRLHSFAPPSAAIFDGSVAPRSRQAQESPWQSTLPPPGAHCAGPWRCRRR